MSDDRRSNNRDSTAYTTGAQEWHIVSLLGDVTSPTTVAHYVTMTYDYVF